MAAEDVLRRYGPAKASVVDVSRALGVSHGSVYRHFDSKAALRDAVVERWLARGTGELTAIAVADEPAPDRLERWLGELAAGKRAKAAADPELFATYLALAAESSAAVDAHVEHLLDELDGDHRRRASSAASSRPAIPPRPRGRCSTPRSASTSRRTPRSGRTRESRRRSTAWSRSCSPASVRVARLAGQHDARRLALNRTRGSIGHHLAPVAQRSSSSAEPKPDSCSRCLIVGKTSCRVAGAVRGERARRRVPGVIDHLVAVDAAARRPRAAARGRSACRSGSGPRAG